MLIRQFSDGSTNFDLRVKHCGSYLKAALILGSALVRGNTVFNLEQAFARKFSYFIISWLAVW